MNTGMVNADKAKLEKKIEQLITQQRFLDFIMQQTEDQKDRTKTLRGAL